MQHLNRQKYSPSISLRLALLVAGSIGFTAVPCLSLATPGNSQIAVDTTAVQQQTVVKPKIQLAILLDTSGSMDGLIDQARNQLWHAVNEFAQAKQNGVSPILEVAVYEYGNDGISANAGHTRLVVGLTEELDKVSEALFALTTNGGNEYCGYAIDRAVSDLDWSNSDDDLKVIFIAGNEPFTQGSVSYQAAIQSATSQGITVNTIHAGNHNEGVQTGWQAGALLAGGNYMSIDHDHKVAHIVAPQDQEIAELNAELNETYLAYGKQGKEAAKRQSDQDSRSESISLGLLAERIKSKVSSLYNNANWDLVDAIKTGSAKLESLEEDQLPAEMHAMSRDEQRSYVESKAQQRKTIQDRISTLSKDRDRFVAEQESAAAAPRADTLSDALTSAVRGQGQEKAFIFEQP